MKLLLGLERLIVRIETAFLVLFLSVMVGLSFAQVLLRNLFDTGLLWGDPLVRHLVLWVGFAGAAIATSEERHIGIDALSKFLSPRGKSASRVITNAFALIVCYLLADAAYSFFLEEKEAGGMLVLDIPSWVGLVVVPPGYALMGFHFLLRLVQSLMDLGFITTKARRHEDRERP